jgi:geranylgeranyl diphosphate synthase type II
MHTAAACEMLHLALLIHDDIIDRDLVRRGRPTAAASLSGTDSGLTHDGLSLALVAGDLALSSAVAIVGEAPVADHEARALTALLVHALEESAEGEALDIAYSARDESLTRKQVALAASLKTAAYSFELPLSAGAILAGAAEETIAEIRVLSRDLGLLYQMTDDHVGVFGTESSTGKSSSSDLREGRLTLLLVEALATQEGPALRELLSREPLTSQDIAQARDIIAACGAEQGHRDAIAEQAETCRERLSHSTLPARLTERLGAFAHTISRRGDTA